MIITLSWLKDHLSTNANLEKIIDKLTGIGLEVEGIKDSQG
jgi:phenylalanyl-tRNA synthetase beta chain